jgi:DNA polymerase III subunit delta'
MQFSQVIAQEAVKQQLVNMVKNNRISHALLFLGKEGSGALPLALAFAQLVALQPDEAPLAADLFGGFSPMQSGDSFILPEQLPEQQGFSKAENMVHPDIHFCYPVIKRKPESKTAYSYEYIKEWREFIQQTPYGNVFDWLQSIGAENKQGNITSDECNEIIKKLSLKSFESKYKILVLWMPEYLGKEGNKLLKLIEEPPPNTLFILVAENDEQILPTILSRCQLVKIPALPKDAVATALIEKAKAPVEKAHQLAAICEGNYREALQLLQHNEEDWLSLLKDWMNTILKRGTVEHIKFTEQLAALGREKQKQFLQYFIHLIEQSIRLKVLGANGFATLETEQSFALSLNKVASPSQQQQIAEELNKAAYYIERNANGKILFQALTIKLYHILKNNMVLAVA